MGEPGVKEVEILFFWHRLLILLRRSSTTRKLIFIYLFFLERIDSNHFHSSSKDSCEVKFNGIITRLQIGWPKNIQEGCKTGTGRNRVGFNVRVVRQGVVTLFVLSMVRYQTTSFVAKTFYLIFRDTPAFSHDIFPVIIELNPESKGNLDSWCFIRRRTDSFHSRGSPRVSETSTLQFSVSFFWLHYTTRSKELYLNSKCHGDPLPVNNIDGDIRSLVLSLFSSADGFRCTHLTPQWESCS